MLPGRVANVVVTLKKQTAQRDPILSLRLCSSKSDVIHRGQLKQLQTYCSFDFVVLVKFSEYAIEKST